MVFFHLSFAKVVFTSSGSLMLHVFAIAFRVRILGLIVASEYPFVSKFPVYFIRVSKFVRKRACTFGSAMCIQVPALFSAGYLAFAVAGLSAGITGF